MDSVSALAPLKQDIGKEAEKEGKKVLASIDDSLLTKRTLKKRDVQNDKLSKKFKTNASKYEVNINDDQLDPEILLKKGKFQAKL